MAKKEQSKDDIGYLLKTIREYLSASKSIDTISSSSSMCMSISVSPSPSCDEKDEE